MVMAIIAMTYSLTMPKLSSAMGSLELKADAERMATLMRMARQEAITVGQSRTVIFYPSSAKYKINGQPTLYLESGTVFVGNTTFTARFGSMPAVSFSPSGAPSSGGTVTLANGSERLYVIVNPVAGRIRVSDSPP